jgi:hypothetical protein
MATRREATGDRHAQRSRPLSTTSCRSDLRASASTTTPWRARRAARWAQCAASASSRDCSSYGSSGRPPGGPSFRSPRPTARHARRRRAATSRPDLCLSRRCLAKTSSLDHRGAASGRRQRAPPRGAPRSKSDGYREPVVDINVRHEVGFILRSGARVSAPCRARHRIGCASWGEAFDSGVTLLRYAPI